MGSALTFNTGIPILPRSAVFLADVTRTTVKILDTKNMVGTPMAVKRTTILAAMGIFVVAKRIYVICRLHHYWLLSAQRVYLFLFCFCFETSLMTIFSRKASMVQASHDGLVCHFITDRIVRCIA
ncbi:hypothetical protein AB6A40_002920 [Gnathostoma spinigerum]|uniref:Uncharacterized protein n=1 Tax=Gnathostoma spinigerum TaxID=75299 RepID=A0ABD6EFM4_9BILA